jgi:hypothetical protein
MSDHIQTRSTYVCECLSHPAPDRFFKYFTSFIEQLTSLFPGKARADVKQDHGISSKLQSADLEAETLTTKPSKL